MFVSDGEEVKMQVPRLSRFSFKHRLTKLEIFYSANDSVLKNLDFILIKILIFFSDSNDFFLKSEEIIVRHVVNITFLETSKCL